MRSRAALKRVLGIFVPVLVGAFGAACSNDFDSSRNVPVRGTLGAELFGVVCDRVGGQSLHEDLTGASYAGICHPQASGTYADTVDQTQLPPMVDGQPNLEGQPVSLAQQQSDRAYGVARMQTLAQDRTILIAALDATFPDIQIPIKDIGNLDPTQSCNAPVTGGEGSLHTELSNLLGRFQGLYNDGTIPQSTEAMGRVMTAFKGATDAQASWARFDARAGYRPLTLALGAARPTIAYANLRDFSNATLSLLSADSQPYQLNPTYDANGNRIPVAGPGYPQLVQLMSAAHAELLNTTADPPVPPLAQASDSTTGATVLNRPRTDLEFLQSLFYAQDPSFGGGNSQYIVQRDARGYASVPLVNGQVPSPFVDKDGDGLPDVDNLGQFVTSDGSVAPSPFLAIGGGDAPARDTAGRALDAPGGNLIYGYLDTSHTYASTLMNHLAPMVDANLMDNHETLMDVLAGAYVVFGARDGSPKTTKKYADGETVTYNAYDAATSPVVDLLYAAGQILDDPSADPTLSLTTTLVTQQPNAVARVVGDGLYCKGLANSDTTAHIPPTSTLWDDIIDVTVQMDQEPGLMADVMRALGDDASLPLSVSMPAYLANLDRISYDRSNLNGPAFNFNTNDHSPPSSLVDRSQPDTGPNRSEMQRFIQGIHDTNGVTACNKPGAIVHAQGLPVFGAIDVPSGPADGTAANLLLDYYYGSKTSFDECEVFKIDNLAVFYLDSMVGSAELLFRDDFLRNGISTPFGSIGASTVGLIEQSSGIGFDGTAGGDTYNGTDVTAPGFWDTSGTKIFRPKPGWLNRLVFFDIGNDSPNQGDPNYLTNHFLADLQGTQIGTSICPERIIPDPCAGSSTCGDTPDIGSDQMVHGLRDCPDGDWLFQRDQDATFILEDDGFYAAITPLVSAFVLATNPVTNKPRHREDLFIGLMEALEKHWQTAQGTADECTLQQSPPVNCTQDGADTYEPLLSQILGSDVLPALHDLINILPGISVPTCTAADPNTHQCTQPGTALDGIGVLASASDAILNPDVAAAKGLTDRQGNVTAIRNDGTTNPQVTPLYLLLESLNEFDEAFTQYAKANPMDAGRQAQWRLGRSQLVDQFLGVNGQNTTTQTFSDPTLQNILPVIVGTARAQLWSYCPPGSSGCTWASTTLASEAAATVGGPTFASAMDVVDAIRQDQAGRTQAEQLVTYLLSAGSNNDALAELMASSDDMIQVMADDANMVPFYHLMSSAMVPSATDAQGNVQRGVIDATTALLARVAGRAFDANGNEICANELDPNAVLNVALSHLVTPMMGSSGPSETPLEVIVDTIADVNRAAPGAPDKLQGADYANMATELSEFLLDGENGLEQFYQIVRNGTEH